MIDKSKLNNMDGSFRENISNVRSGLKYVLKNYILVPSEVAVSTNHSWYSEYDDFSIVIYAFWVMSDNYKNIFEEFCK